MENDKNESRVLLNRFVANDRDAADLLYQRYWRRLQYLTQKRIFGRLKSKLDPEDITQEAFADFFEAARAGKVVWRKQGDLWRLLSAIAIHKTLSAVEHFQAAKRSLEREEPFFHGQHDSKTSPIRQAAIIELEDLIESILADEKPILRQVAELTIAGHSEVEVANAIRRSPRTVRRLRIVLRERLASKYGLYGFELKENETPSQMQSGAETIGSYQLLRLLGQGHFSRVYQSRHLESGAKCCVKILRKRWAENGQIKKLFQREVEILNSFQDDSSPQVLGLGQLEKTKQDFIVFTMPEGQPIEQLLEAQPSAKRLIDFAWRACKAFARLHELHVIHGDIKPDHLFVSNDGSIRIIDFAFAVHPSVPWDKASFGTEQFLAPERETNPIACPTKQTDCYAFGKSLEMLVGQLKQRADKPEALQSLIQLSKQFTYHDPAKRLSFNASLPQIRSILSERDSR